MTARVKNAEGFTLSELLLSVAILLVLAAIAVPSIVTAQSNMRMVELNNAAESLANAAQTQMTAKKVSGTWLALIEKGGTGSDAHEVKYDLAVNAPAASASADTYYMTADQARTNGIVPSLSIDDQVRNGDYIIEFTASTANVVSVFYTDGKTGFFGSAPEGGTTAAQKYYTDGGARDQASRKNANPMIGYYQGVPAGATNAVALQNPVIWVDKDDGVLCVRNDSANESLETTVAILIAKKDGTHSFKLSGLDESPGATLTVQWDEDKESLSLSGSDILSTTADKTTHRIDLNKLVDAVRGAQGSQQGDSLLSLLEAYQALEEIQVTATVASAQPCVPASAQAFIEWPSSPAKLRVLVTNPHIDDKKSTFAANGTYSKPEDTLVLVNGAIQESVNLRPDGYGDAPKDDKNVIELKGTVASLSGTEASRQSYSGGWVNLDSPGVDMSSDPAAVDKANTPIIEARPGSFTSQKGTRHEYQVAEIWLNDTLLGSYDASGNWAWSQGEQPSFLVLLGKGSQAPYNALENPVTGVQISAQALRAYRDSQQGVSPDKDNGYVLYVRTMPRIEEVRDYFASKATSLAEAIYNGDGQSDAFARSSDLQSAALQQAFEQEFGLPSSAVLWTAALKNPRPDSVYAYSADESDAFVYYAVCPFAPQDSQGNLTRSDLGLSLMWRFSVIPNGSYSPKAGTLLAQDFRDAVYDDKMKSLMFENVAIADPLRAPTVGSVSPRADIALPATADYLYYREMYFYSEGKQLFQDGLPLYSWSPYLIHEGGSWWVSDTGKTAAPSTSSSGSGGPKFLGWSALEDGSGTLFPSDSGLDEFDAELLEKFPFGTVNLHASFKYRIGLMYLEFDKDGNMIGYSGYLNGGSTASSLGDQGTIAAWGYYVVAPVVDVDSNKNLIPKANGARLKSEGQVVINGVRYYAYPLPNKTMTDSAKQSTQEVKCESGPTTEWYYVNVNFAAAVTQNSQEADSWGSNESPWKVRHASQFIGALKTYQVQPYYMDHHFEQTHDIDFRDVAKPESCKYTSAFTGSYDGGGYGIRSFYLLLHDYYVGSTSEGDFRGTGLFAQVKGTENSRVALKNIKLVANPNDTYVLQGQKEDTGFNGSSDAVGFLVGSAYYCDISNCTVEGEDALVLIKYGSGPNGWGCLVGGLYDSTISDSKVDRITFLGERFDTSMSWGNTATITVGGLVGRMQNSTIDSCSVSNTAVGTENTLVAYKNKNSVLAVGGLVGAVYSGSVTGKSDVEKTELRLPAALALEKDSYRSYLGGIAGMSAISADDLICTFGAVNITGEGYVSIAVKNAVGESL